MSSRTPIVVVIGLFIVGAGAWWLLSKRGSQGEPDLVAPIATAPPIAMEGGPSATMQPAHASAEVAIGKPAAENPPDQAIPSSASPWPAGVLEFADQPDSDPGLSRVLETSMRMAVDAALDRGTHDLHSVTCRGASCQILAINRATEMGNPWATTVAAMLRDLGAKPVLNPSTGAELKPNVQVVRVGRGDAAGNVAVIGFE